LSNNNQFTLLPILNFGGFSPIPVGFAVFWIRILIGSGFNQVLGSGFGIRIRIQQGKNYPQEISCFEVLDVHV
jgi:hypothetical protein